MSNWDKSRRYSDSLFVQGKQTAKQDDKTKAFEQTFGRSLSVDIKNQMKDSISEHKGGHKTYVENNRKKIHERNYDRSRSFEPVQEQNSEKTVRLLQFIII